MILEILKYPDPRLREISKPVTQFDAKLKELAKNMFETMYDENGIGLAAPQVGQLIRMLVIDTRQKVGEGKDARYEKTEMTDLEKKITQPLIIINPEIVKGDGKTFFNEGCLSVPSFFDEVERFKTIELKYQDLDGKTQSMIVDGLLAICIQHEMDHLEGTLFIDHLSLLKSNKIKNQIKKHGYPDKEPTSEILKDSEKEKV